MSVPIIAAAGFALIVTNNRSLDFSRPDLRYADDDGVKYAELFDETLGEDRVTLLTELDAETRALYPEWNARATPPTKDALDRAIDALARAIDQKHAAGDKTEVYVVLAGHGDVDRGQGYVELADRRLSAADLEEKVIGRLGADRIHLVLDSCNSYFMLNPRKPGGKRFAASNDGARDLLERHPNVGALISTSAEAVTYEWSEVQSGIFSYEVRSGLRGAADADTDGRITYEELKAFLATANRNIENDLYRPKIYARGPAADDKSVLFDSAKGARELALPKSGTRRITVRDRLGVRVLDLHKEDGTLAVLRLPANGELGVFEEVAAIEGQRPTIAFRVYTSTRAARLMIDELPLSPPTIAARGEAPVFQSVFNAPFGEAALAEYRAAPAQTEPEVYGVSKRDAERLGLYLRTTAGYEREGRHFASLFSAGGSVVLGALGVNDLEDHGGQLSLTGLVAWTGSLLFAANAVTTLLVSSKSEDLVDSYREVDLTTEASRGEAVKKTEKHLEQLAEEYRGFRLSMGWIMLGIGAVSAGYVGVDGALTDREQGLRSIDVVLLGNAAVMAVIGLYQLLVHEYPVERTWALYSSEKELSD